MASSACLVDGAVLRNFPVDVLKEMHRGPIIGVDVARRDGIDLEDFRDPPGFFGWVAAHGLQAAPPIASLLMRAATLAVDPWEGRSGADLLIAPEMPDIDMRDWKRFDEAVAAGYEAAVAALQGPHGLFQASVRSRRPAAPEAGAFRSGGISFPRARPSSLNDRAPARSGMRSLALVAPLALWRLRPGAIRDRSRLRSQRQPRDHLVGRRTRPTPSPRAPKAQAASRRWSR